MKREYPSIKAPSRSTDGWTDDRVETLKKLWADGLSASQIAAELGGVTRNAIIGKVNRLGLAGRATNASGQPMPRKPVGPRMYKPRRKLIPYAGKETFRGNAAIAHEHDETEPQPELIEIPFEQRKTLLQLNDSNCHWPVGDPCKPDFFFCGGEAVTDQPYCSYHGRLAHDRSAEVPRGRPPKASVPSRLRALQTGW